MKLIMPRHRTKKVNGDVDMTLHTFLHSSIRGAEWLGNSFSGNIGKQLPHCPLTGTFKVLKSNSHHNGTDIYLHLSGF
jgi:hypothetical protein